MADYEYWSRQYQREFTPGEFGENITVTGDPDYEWKVGDRLQFHEVRIEVTAPAFLVGCSRLCRNQTFFCGIRESESQRL